jgi:hypothetical protein
MPTAAKVINEIYLLPMKEREKVARHIIEFGIKGVHHDLPEILDVKVNPTPALHIFKLTWCVTTVTLKFNFIWRKRPCQLKIHV